MSNGGWLRGVLHGCGGLAAGAALILAVAGCTGSSGGSTAADGGVVTALPGDGGGVTALPGDGGGDAPASSDDTGGNQQTGVPSPSATPTLDASEADGECPYLSAQEAADLEGNRVGRTTVLPTTPPGCRFYFAYNLSHMTMEITTQTFEDAIDANNAMVTMANAGRNASAVEGIGDAAVLFQTTFYPPDGDQDWACAFVRGNLLVVVKTDQVSPSYNARHVAETIAPRF